MGGVGLVEAVAQHRAAVDALLSADRTGVSSTEFAAAMAEWEADRRRMESVDQHNIAEACTRGIAGEFGRTSPVDLLINLLRVSPGEARARVDRARDLGPRRAYSGEPLEPILPLVSAAVRAGEISAAHASVIIKAVEKIPHHRAAEFSGIVEAGLVEQARSDASGRGGEGRDVDAGPYRSGRGAAA